MYIVTIKLCAIGELAVSVWAGVVMDYKLIFDAYKSDCRYLLTATWIGQ